MKQIVLTYAYNRNMNELSERIQRTLTDNPTWSVQTMSTIMYDNAAGRIYDATVVFNIDRPQATLDTPKLAGDVWDNGYRLPVNGGPVPTAKSRE